MGKTIASGEPSVSTTMRKPALWLRIAGTVGGVFLGAVLLLAAWAKTPDPVAFAAQIEYEGLDFLFPAEVVVLIALGIEAFLGCALVLALRRGWVLLPTAALVVFFLFLTGRGYWYHLQGIAPPEDDCGCFGTLVERTPAEAFWQDLLLMVPALGLAWLGRTRGPGWPRRRLAAMAVLTAATVLVAWRAPELPLDDLATRLRPGIDPLALCIGQVEDGQRVCLADVLPELADGEHVVVMADLTDAAFGSRVERLNEYHWAGRGPLLWVLTSATQEQSFTFHFSYGPAFEIRHAPSALLRRLYRTLPRSFLVRDGAVAATYGGLPPLAELAAESTR